MDSLGKALMGVGAALFLVGCALWLATRVGWLPLGRLPGDVLVRRPGFRLYFPIATCIVLSLIGSLVLWVIGAIRR
ncbi:MAG: DUF2905 domain-containing protein [Fimbriimonadaceae bacterium]